MKVSRRVLLKDGGLLLFGMGVAGLSPLFPKNVSGSTALKPEVRKMSDATDLRGFSILNTIFASFSNEEFRPKLESLASELQCRIYWSEDPPDIVAVPWFVAVVDRNVLGSDAWTIYEEYCKEIGEKEWCFLIDNEPPSCFAFKQIRIEEPEIQDSLIEMICNFHPRAVRKYKVDFSLKEGLTQSEAE
ncbi:MAG: hypothetical protein FJ123_20755 [Deltaproteobacteria bacterium]|nr:hypothetical protein [Deltaproteobacteria bacterium]